MRLRRDRAATEATKKLKALLGEGKLTVITAQPLCEDHRPVWATPVDPSYYVCHQVVSLEKGPKGRLIARTAEGDWCTGNPTALLKRLTEAI